jgi:hypothetical protein
VKCLIFPINRAGHPCFFHASALASAKLIKHGSANKKSAKKSESAERERKKCEFALFCRGGGRLYVCMYVRMYVRGMYVCMYVCTFVCMYVFKDICVWGCMYV